MTDLLINGRFLSQIPTGVQRYATQIVQTLDAELSDDHSPWRGLRVALLVPPNVGAPPAFHRIEVRTVGHLTGQAWEQLELSRHVGDGLLLCLGNTAPLLARKLAVTIHDASVFAIPNAYSRAFRTWYQFLLPHLGRRASRIITCSEFSRAELQRLAGIPAAKLRVVYLGAEHILAASPDPRIFERLTLRHSRFMLAVSSAGRHKNFAALAEAVGLLGDTDFDVVVAGGENNTVFRTAAADGSLVRAGYVTDGELRALYQRAECFVFPSLYEGFGLPPLEAMICGCPVIVARAASLPEVCGQAAVFCDPQDPRDIARAVQELMADPERREQMRTLGSRHVAEFTWRRTVRHLLTNLDDLLQA